MNRAHMRTMPEFHARDHAINVSASSAHRLICCPLWPHSVSRIRIYANSFDGLTFGVRFNFPPRQRLQFLRLFSVFFIVYRIWCCGPLFYRLTYSNESRATATGKKIWQNSIVSNIKNVNWQRQRMAAEACAFIFGADGLAHSTPKLSATDIGWDNRGLFIYFFLLLHDRVTRN